MEKDSYSLVYDPVLSTLIFRNKHIFIPFDFTKTSEVLNNLKSVLQDEKICAADIYLYPSLIFRSTLLKHNPYFSKWVYAIIETWVSQVETSIHKSENKRLFDGFLFDCKTACQLSEYIDQQIISKWTEKDVSYKEFFDLEFIDILISFSILLTDDPKMITDLINGLTILHDYYKDNNENESNRFDILTKPIFKSIKKEIQKIKRFESFSNKEFVYKNEIIKMGIHFPISKNELLTEIKQIKHNTPKQSTKNPIIIDWINYKQKFLSTQPKKLLKVKQIALLYCYEGKQITRENADQIASDYGYISKDSGEGLYQDYLFFMLESNRTLEPSSITKRTLNNKIKLFESILDILPVEFKHLAEKDIKKLQKIYFNQYE